MNRQTRRRAVLGGLAATAVGTASVFLNRRRWPATDRSRWLRPVDPVAESETFAFVGGVAAGGELAVEVAMRERIETGQEIVLFTAGEDPVTEYLPPLRSFWRFDAPLGERSPGEYELRVGEATLPVELVADRPPESDARVAVTPRVTWRADHIAHARGYGTGDGGGRLEVAFRERTGVNGLAAVAFRNPEGREVGRRAVPDGVRELTFAVDPLTAAEADGQLLGHRNGETVDVVPMFYHSYAHERWRRRD